MINEAIVLAGGLGTRLQETIPGLPKAMAPVAGHPFLSYLIDYLRMQGVQRFIFSLGHKAEAIESFLREQYPTLDYAILREEEPLGTGGAISLSMKYATSRHLLVTNGDTLFKVKVNALFNFHLEKKAECTLALKPMKQFSRYGVVQTNEQGCVTSFKEKQFYEQGTINGGIYIIDRELFAARPLPQRYSFEKDYLERFYTEGTIYGQPDDGYFIDIGIPEDYSKAGRDLERQPLDLGSINASWTLFLDRDGVINDERVGEYVLSWDQFIFSKGVLDAFKKFSGRFGRILIVSNQRGVGKGLMTEEALQSIHLEMQREVQIVGGRIDKIYYCTEKDDKCFYRKPNPGMAFRAAKDFNDLDFSKAVMVGNKPGDMRFGRSAGMYTVFLTTTNPGQPYPHPDIDMMFSSLAEFADRL